VIPSSAQRSLALVPGLLIDVVGQVLPGVGDDPTWCVSAWVSIPAALIAATASAVAALPVYYGFSRRA